MKRRDFIKTAAATTALSIIGPRAISAETVYDKLDRLIQCRVLWVGEKLDGTFVFVGIENGVIIGRAKTNHATPFVLMWAAYHANRRADVFAREPWGLNQDWIECFRHDPPYKDIWLCAANPT